MKDKVPKRRLSINFPCSLFSLLDILTTEAGTDRLSCNVGAVLQIIIIIIIIIAAASYSSSSFF
jgi:hypothetical protein